MKEVDRRKCKGPVCSQRVPQCHFHLLPYTLSLINLVAAALADILISPAAVLLQLLSLDTLSIFPCLVIM